MPADRTITNEMFRRMLEGESLRSVCRDPAMPDRSTFFRWLVADPELEREYEVARRLQAHLLADETLDIADDASNDWMTRERGNGTLEKVPDLEHIARSRLRVDTRKWYAARLNPKKYGDRLDVEV